MGTNSPIQISQWCNCWAHRIPPFCRRFLILRIVKRVTMRKQMFPNSEFCFEVWCLGTTVRLIWCREFKYLWVGREHVPRIAKLTWCVTWEVTTQNGVRNLTGKFCFCNLEGQTFVSGSKILDEVRSITFGRKTWNWSSSDLALKRFKNAYIK